MELHKNTANAFINYLRKHGYPEESIVTEWGDNKYQIDIAVLDKKMAMPVAIYEVKGSKNESSKQQGQKQLKRYMNYLGYPVVSGLVFSKQEPPYFEYEELSFNDIVVDEEYFKKHNGSLTFKAITVEPLAYSFLENSAEPKLRYSLKRKKERKLSTFNWIC